MGVGWCVCVIGKCDRNKKIFPSLLPFWKNTFLFAIFPPLFGLRQWNFFNEIFNLKEKEVW